MYASIYKPGQGYWTRVMSAIGVGLIVLMGAAWISKLMRGVRIAAVEPIYVQVGVAMVLVMACGALTYYLLGVKPKVVDFMIATEGEMKKVNWSTRREILGSTWLVIGLMVLIGVLCFAFDVIFAQFFAWMGVLDVQGNES